MFEFHGWAAIRVPNPDLNTALRHELEKVAVERLRKAVQSADDQFSLFDVRVTGNELIVLYAHGLRNHRYRKVIELFRWVAIELPHSYGLLYMRDGESEQHENEFRVWRLARGILEEMADPFLSPCIPTLEDRWHGEPDDEICSLTFPSNGHASGMLVTSGVRLYMIAARWIAQEVADIEGLVRASGDICNVQGVGRSTTETHQEFKGWLNVAVLAQREIYGGKFVVKCGEVLENGSFGVVVLESAPQGEFLWSFVSRESNPFDRIEVQGSVVIVLSTSGSVLRFTPPASSVDLWLA